MTMMYTMLVGLMTVTMPAGSADGGLSGEGESGKSAAPHVTLQDSDSSNLEPPVTGDRPDRHMLVFNNLSAGRGNPIGLASFVFFGYRYHLFNSESILLKPAFVEFGPQFTLTPDFLEGGLELTVKPLAILTFEARYMLAAHSPLLTDFQSFKTPHADYSPRRRIQRGMGDEGYRTYGGFLRLKTIFEMQLGAFAISNEFEIHRMDVALREGDQYFYSSRWDTVFPNHGWGFANFLNLIVFTKSKFLIGLRYEVTKPFIKNHWFDNFELHQRLGLLWGYPLIKRQRGWLREVLGLGSVQWWLAHPYRTGREVSQLVPYVIMGISMNGGITL